MTGAVGESELGVEPGWSPAGDAAIPIILGATPCSLCEAALREGLESCPGCGTAIPMDVSEWTAWGAYEPKTPVRQKILLLPPLVIAGAGFVVWVLVLALSALAILSGEAGELLGWLGAFLIMGGFMLLFVGLAALGLLWLLERVGKGVGDIVADEEPDGLVAPTGPSWHVVFPRCTHLVQLGSPGRQPQWVWCDGSALPLDWPAVDDPGPFAFDGHEASFHLETHVDASAAVGGIAASVALAALVGGEGGVATVATPGRHR